MGQLQLRSTPRRRDCQPVGDNFGMGGRADPSLSRYLTRDDWCLIQPHGSVRWTRLTSIPRGTLGWQNVGRAVIDGWKPNEEPPAANSVYQRWVSTVEQEAQPNHQLLGRDHSLVGVPALSAPLASSAKFECPPAHLEHLRLVMTQSDLLLCIGWRGQEPHFQRLLRDTMGNPPDLAVVSRSHSSATEILGGLAGTLGITPNTIASDAAGFSGFRRAQGSTLRDSLEGWANEAGARRQALWHAYR